MTGLTRHAAAARWAASAALLMWGLSAGPAAAQLNSDIPELEGLGIVHRGGVEIPVDLAFTDEDGEATTLGRHIGGGRPVILTLVYYNCPMLCNLMLDSFVSGLRDLEWTAGQEFDIVTVSIDPRETPEAAWLKKAHQIENYGRPSAADGWHFLTGEEAPIAALADSVGFSFRFNEERQEFMHAAGLFVITPEGKVSQTLLGLDYPAKTLRLALVEAADGEIGSALDQALLFCFVYDAESGRYAPAAMKIMRLAGGVTLLVLVLWLSVFWRRERRRKLLVGV